MWFKRRRPGPEPSLDREASLAMRPVRNRQVREQVLEAGLMRLSYPSSVKPWFAGMALRLGMWDGRPLTRKLELDELGTFCWNLIDGERSVSEMAAELAERYGLPAREAELSVSAFLRELGLRGVIGVRTEAPDKNPSA